MAAPAKAKSKKALTKSDIAHEAERWAKHQRDIDKLERERSLDAELKAMIARHAEEMRPLVEKYESAIEALETKAATVRSRVIEWLSKQKKSVTVESKSAIAKLITGTRAGNRVPDPEKFIAACKKQKKDPWPAVGVTIKLGEPILGKNDFDKICAKEDVEFSEATLKLK